MQSHQLNAKQVAQLLKQIEKHHDYYDKLRERMVARHFIDEDELWRQTVKTMKQTYELMKVLRGLAVARQKPPPDDGQPY